MIKAMRPTKSGFMHVIIPSHSGEMGSTYKQAHSDSMKRSIVAPLRSFHVDASRLAYSALLGQPIENAKEVSETRASPVLSMVGRLHGVE
jgi:hypothetical protein